MEKDYSYSSQVNRRLASTYFLISSYEQQQNKSSLLASEKQAYIDSILLQLYCACVAYCNELLSHHNKPALTPSGFNLIDILENKKHEGVSELNELRLLYQQKKSGLFQLCKLFQNLMSIGTKEEQEEKRKQGESQAYNAENIKLSSNNNIINLVAVDTSSEDLSGSDFSDLKVVKNLLRTLQDLIDRQREYLLEY